MNGLPENPHLPRRNGRHLCFLASLAAVWMSIYATSSAKDQATPAKNDDSIDRLASQLAPVAGKSPKDSCDAIQMADGFEVQLVATEPLLRDPVAVDFDEYGRMYVAELPQYNSYVVDDFKGKGSIRLLADTDNDGQYDKSTVFADNLEYPTAVACWDGGLFVGAAPNLFYMKDTDGDGKADTRDVVLTGFGTDKAGEAHLNSFRWGFDNRFHFSTSLSGGDIGVGADENTPKRSARGRGMILDPRNQTGFELTSGGGQHGMSMDNWGHKFVCSNSVPAQMLMYDDRYLARNPLARADAAAVDIAPDGKFTHLFRISPEEPWRKLRTRLRKEGQFRGSDEGGKPFGFFTGATGITIYRGDAWPKEYRGNLLVGDVANNLVYRARLEQDGVRLIAHRADAGAEFLASADIWFRPVQMANAPDGNIYVLDIYRELIEGAAFLPPEFMKYLNILGGNDQGRILRIAPQGFQAKPMPRLGDATSHDLVAHLDHPNGWHRDTASRLIYQRQDRTVIADLEKLAASASNAEGRMMALYSLEGIDALADATLIAALEDNAPLVRSHALRLAEAKAATSPAVVDRMCGMTSDPDVRVRYQLTFSLGSVSTKRVRTALAELVLKDGADKWFRIAAWTSLRDSAAPVFEHLSRDGAFRGSSHGRSFLLTLAEQIGARNQQHEIAVVIKTLQDLPDAEKSLSSQLVESLVKNQKGEARAKMLAATSERTADILAELVADAKKSAVDQSMTSERRTEAIRSLTLAPFEDAANICEQLLDLREPREVQSAALQTLAEFSDDTVAALILRQWRGFSPTIRAEAVETLFSRSTWVMAFLKAVQAGELSTADLDPTRVILLKKHREPKIADLATQLFAGVGVGKRTDTVKAYEPALQLSGNADNGKAIFKKNCSACHKLEGVGNEIGAELKGIRNRGLSAVMLNILDPNREVKPQYLTYVIITIEGKTVTGMIQTETANSLTLRRPDGTTTEVSRSDIDELSSTGLSFMPEGLEKQIDLQGMADLLSYLDSIQ